MEQLKYNEMKNIKNNIYSDTRSIKYKKNNKTEINPYPKYLKQENQMNIKSFSLYNSNNSNISEIEYKNNSNTNKDKKVIVNYYSFPVGIKNARVMNMNMNKSNIMEQYSIKNPAQNNYYLSYLQNKRNTYDFQDKNEDIKNTVYSDVRRLNTSETDVNALIRNKIFSKNKNNNNNISNDKLFIKRLNTSKSTNNFLIEDDHDISIEYNNPPIINSKRRNKDNYLNINTNENNGYEFINFRLKKIKELSIDMNNKNNMNNNYKEKFDKNSNRITKRNGYIAYIGNEINKSSGIFDKKSFDINASNTDKDNNAFISEERKYEYLMPEKNIYLNKQPNIKQKFDKNELKNLNKFNYNASLDLYQVKNNKILDLNKNKNKKKKNKKKI